METKKEKTSLFGEQSLWSSGLLIKIHPITTSRASLNLSLPRLPAMLLRYLQVNLYNQDRPQVTCFHALDVQDEFSKHINALKILRHHTLFWNDASTIKE